jgi:hypothetical protein
MATPSRAEFYREQAKILREKAPALVHVPDIRKDLEYIAREYELMAESIEHEERKRRSRKPQG